MFSVSEVTKKIGVARSTLLYYERINLIDPERDPDNGYRVYSQDDLNRLVLLKQLQKAGLTLSECRRFLEGKPDMELVEERLTNIEQELVEMKMARDLLRSIYHRFTGKNPPEEEVADLRKWHADFEKRAADAHYNWLQEMGFSAKEALYIRWVSRDMTNNKDYMEHFFKVFENMKRQGPGSKESTLKSFNSISDKDSINNILEIGCGTGVTSITLADACSATITALDNHQPFLDRFQKEVTKGGYENRVKLINMDMHDLDYPDGSFDLIWSEGSSYFIGFETALKQWKRLIRNNGYLFISDAVWLTDNPTEECKAYWDIEYPQISNPEERVNQAKELGYEVIDNFNLPRRDWKSFYMDMEETVAKQVKKHGMNKTFMDMEDEIRVDRNFGDEYGYVCLLLRKK
ncbi:MAG: MerR family transcriptional regulator [Deltaproteobacteria bacterium]|nr:MerR family transcriptional regulator [Deltaproteobacteria bacterium]